MELPEELKKIYRHWSGHVSRGEGKRISIPEQMEWFINERLCIWKQKVAGSKPPFTTDPILSQYRFCNIFREFDKQTIEFHTLLNPLRDDFPLWLLNIFYCRMVARTETIYLVGLLSFNPAENKELYERLVNSPRPRYGTPYVFPISVIQRSLYPTRELFISEYLPKIMREVAAEIETLGQTSVYDGVEKIIRLFGYNLNFLWTEVCIDVAYQFPQYINLFGRFPIGPGSIPTFKKLNAKSDPSVVVQKLAEKNITTDITYKGKYLCLSAENWEGIGCEYRKYSNLAKGHGRKRIYRVAQ